MEEADLLRERLQAITEKRRIQEDIAKKRGEIEEEKLKLQYLKKKALREQWLMDGLSSQNVQEEEAMRAQVQKEQQQAMLLQQQIHRIESEIDALETEEMNISANEELILKRLKEVERTAEDIIKEVKDNMQKEMTQNIYSAKFEIPESYTPTLMRRLHTPVEDSGSEAEKKAMYAMEISVEKDQQGKCEVLSIVTVTSEEFQEKGVKVYDDGRKAVYALQSAGKESEDALDELGPLEVEELLRKAKAKKDPSDLAYHEPVFSCPYSRSSTSQKVEQGMVSPGPNGFYIQRKTPSPLQPDSHASQHPEATDIRLPLTPDHVNFEMNRNTANRQKANIAKCCDRVDANSAELMQKRLIPVSDSQLGFGTDSPCNLREDVCFCVENSFPSDMDCSEPVTMIFMGYKKAELDEENVAIQVELVVIGNDEEEDDEEPPLFYHPEGYHSKVFQPRNDNLHHSEVRHSFINSHGSGEHLTKYGTQNADTSVLTMKQPQLGNCALPAQQDPRIPYEMKT